MRLSVFRCDAEPARKRASTRLPQFKNLKESLGPDISVRIRRVHGARRHDPIEGKTGSTESHPEFTPSFLPSGIERKNKTERDHAALLAVLKELVVRFVTVCPYDAGRIPAADRNLIRKAGHEQSNALKLKDERVRGV
jgi:hypothetical protein